MSNEEYVTELTLYQAHPSRHRLLFGEWLSEEEDPLTALVEEYYKRCDAYDRRYCSGISPRTGEPLPVTGDELGAINSNAREVRTEICARNGISFGEFHQALQRYNKCK